MIIRTIPARVTGPFRPIAAVGQVVHVGDVLGSIDGFEVFAIWDGTITKVAGDGSWVNRCDTVIEVNSDDEPAQLYHLLAIGSGVFTPAAGIVQGKVLSDGEVVGTISGKVLAATWGGTIVYLMNPGRRIGRCNTVAIIDHAQTSSQGQP